VIDSSTGEKLTRRLPDVIGEQIQGARAFVAGQPDHVIAKLDTDEKKRRVQRGADSPRSR